MHTFIYLAATLLGVASAHPWASGIAPNATTTTESLTTYTTTTVCPVTSAIVSGKSTFYTTALTTSTVTITSCKGGCHASGTSVSPIAHITSTVVPPIMNVTSTVVPPIISITSTRSEPLPVVTTMTVPVTSMVTSFVPCSTAIFENSGTTFYSTWLTASSYMTTYETTSCSTIFPVATPISSSVVVKPSPSASASTSVMPHPITMSTSVTAPQVTSPAETLSCSSAETIYTTVHSTVYVPGSASGGAAPTGKCSSCEIETCTVTLGNGYVTTILVEYTVSATATATATASGTPYVPGSSLSWSATSINTYWQPTGTSVPSGAAHPSGAALPSGSWFKTHHA